MGAEADAWARFIQQCVLKRKSIEDFESLVKVQSRVTAITSSELAQVILKPRPLPSLFAHPLVPRYVERLVQLDRLEVQDVLLSLLQYSPYANKSENPVNDTEKSDHRVNRPDNPGDTDTVRDLRLEVLHRIARLIANGWEPQKARWFRIMKAVSQWMSSIATHTGSPHVEEDAVPVAIGTIFSVLVERDSTSKSLASSVPEGTLLDSILSEVRYIAFRVSRSIQASSVFAAQSLGNREESPLILAALNHLKKSITHTVASRPP